MWHEHHDANGVTTSSQRMKMCDDEFPLLSKLPESITVHWFKSHLSRTNKWNVVTTTTTTMKTTRRNKARRMIQKQYLITSLRFDINLGCAHAPIRSPLIEWPSEYCSAFHVCCKYVRLSVVGFHCDQMCAEKVFRSRQSIWYILGISVSYNVIKTHEHTMYPTNDSIINNRSTSSSSVVYVLQDIHVTIQKASYKLQGMLFDATPILGQFFALFILFLFLLG